MARMTLSTSGTMTDALRFGRQFRMASKAPASAGLRETNFRACLKILKGAAERDLGRGQGGEAGASPEWAVTAEPTQATGKRPAARRVFVEKAVWLRCSSVEDP